MVTTTDSGGNRQGWRITDELLGLRCWGSDRFYGLPRQTTVDCTIGSEPVSTIQVGNPHGLVSRIHARLSRASGTWQLFNKSKNGTRVDGMPVNATGAVLAPGSVVVMGRMALIAESEGLIRLRRVLFRLLGWTAYEAVDQALCSLRDAAIERIPLVLKGKGARLEVVARRLHLETLGPEPPFVVCDGKELRASIAEATGGTLCLTKHARTKIAQIIPAVRTPGSRVRATIISPSKADVDWISEQAGRIASIAVPTPQQRRAELPRILAECIEDVIAGTPSLPEYRFHDDDIACLCGHGFLDLGDVEEQALRLVTHRAYGPTYGDAMLGLSHGTLFHWARTRGLK